MEFYYIDHTLKAEDKFVSNLITDDQIFYWCEHDRLLLFRRLLTLRH